VIEVGQQLETKTSMYDGNFTTRPSANFGKKNNTRGYWHTNLFRSLLAADTPTSLRSFSWCVGKEMNFKNQEALPNRAEQMIGRCTC
jgi:hypothetical protein